MLISRYAIHTAAAELVIDRTGRSPIRRES
jgi:hypothetical protein